MKISLNWLREFVDLPESSDELRPLLDDLGLVVEGEEKVGQEIEDVVVARVREIRAIKGADRVRLVVVDAGGDPLEIVCGAMNFAEGNYVPLAPVGAVLPGGFVITERSMRGVTSHGMLCSSRELRLSDDHEGLMILDDLVKANLGEKLIDALGIAPDVIFNISVEGNRPDAWSVEGVARDLAARLNRPLRAPVLASPTTPISSQTFASAAIDDPDLCGRLTVSVLRNVKVGTSPSWVVQRLLHAGMRPVSNVVDASNLVMLELGQPTHPYDAARVAKKTLRARRARRDETLTTLDGVTRELARVGRGLGDTGEDCVIVDGEDQVLGLAGIMGGASSEIGPQTTDVLLEAAFFDPMTIARSSKRHALRSEASNRFERGVDPQMTLRAAARFVEILRQSSPDLQWLSNPLDVCGNLPEPPTLVVTDRDIERLLGVAIHQDEVATLLRALGFAVAVIEGTFTIKVPSNRPDVRDGVLGRADVIEEIARLYSYQRLPRHLPVWSDVGSLTARQRLRRQLRDVVVDAGAFEVWTPTLITGDDYEILHPDWDRIRITNPLVSEESVLRATLITGLVRVWARNFERRLGDVILAELGVVFIHPSATNEPRRTKGGIGGAVTLDLPQENERLTAVLARPDDDATSAVALWRLLEQRLGLEDVVVRATTESVRGFHPTRVAMLVDRASGAVIGHVGEVDFGVITAVAGVSTSQRLGLVDLDLDVLASSKLAMRRSAIVQVPSRFPSALMDLAFVTPRRVNAHDLAHALRIADELVQSVKLFDVYQGPGLDPNTRSLAFALRLGALDRTLSESELTRCRENLIEGAARLGAILR